MSNTYLRNKEKKAAKFENLDVNKQLNIIFDMMLHNDKEGTCCICGKHYDDYGNNAMPLVKGRCCGDCERIVLSLRQFLATKGIRYFDVKTPVFSLEEVRQKYETEYKPLLEKTKINQ